MSNCAGFLKCLLTNLSHTVVTCYRICHMLKYKYTKPRKLYLSAQTKIYADFILRPYNKLPPPPVFKCIRSTFKFECFLQVK